jgi:hypothetical protein
MWEYMNGELIWMDKEMGYTENERHNSVGNVEDYATHYVRSDGDRIGASRIAVGVAGGMIAAKAVPRVGSWLLWVAGIFTLIMIFM